MNLHIKVILGIGQTHFLKLFIFKTSLLLELSVKHIHFN